jgi:hypothetical protein
LEGTINGFIAAFDVRPSSKATSTPSPLFRIHWHPWDKGPRLPRAATGGYQYYPQYSTNLDSGLSSTSKTLAREGDPARPPMSVGQVQLNINDNDSYRFPVQGLPLYLDHHGGSLCLGFPVLYNYKVGNSLLKQLPSTSCLFGPVLVLLTCRIVGNL